jgi:hypothetical protein
MISWQQWSKRWGSWSGWRANCPAFHQGVLNSGPGLTQKEHSPQPSVRVVRRQSMCAQARKAKNYFSTTLGRGI